MPGISVIVRGDHSQRLFLLIYSSLYWNISPESRAHLRATQQGCAKCGGTSPCQRSWHRKRFQRKEDNEKRKKLFTKSWQVKWFHKYVQFCTMETTSTFLNNFSPFCYWSLITNSLVWNHDCQMPICIMKIQFFKSNNNFFLYCGELLVPKVVVGNCSQPTDKPKLVYYARKIDLKSSPLGG